MRTTRPTLIILGLASSALAYLSYHSIAYENYTSGFIGLIFFGGLGLALLTLALFETYEQRKKF